jgi:preprotein translocase subunit SecD
LSKNSAVELAIIVNDRLVAAPVIQTALGGRLAIGGSLTRHAAEQISAELKQFIVEPSDG